MVETTDETKVFSVVERFTKSVTICLKPLEIETKYLSCLSRSPIAKGNTYLALVADIKCKEKVLGD